MARGFHHALLRDQPVQTLVSAKRTQCLRRRCSQSSWGLARAVGQRRRRLAQRACPRPSLLATAVLPFLVHLISQPRRASVWARLCHYVYFSVVVVLLKNKHFIKYF